MWPVKGGGSCVRLVQMSTEHRLLRDRADAEHFLINRITSIGLSISLPVLWILGFITLKRNIINLALAKKTNNHLLVFEDRHVSRPLFSPALIWLSLCTRQLTESIHWLLLPISQLQSFCCSASTWCMTGKLEDEGNYWLHFRVRWWLVCHVHGLRSRRSYSDLIQFVALIGRPPKVHAASCLLL